MVRYYDLSSCIYKASDPQRSEISDEHKIMLRSASHLSTHQYAPSLHYYPYHATLVRRSAKLQKVNAGVNTPKTSVEKLVKFLVIIVSCTVTIRLMILVLESRDETDSSTTGELLQKNERRQQRDTIHTSSFGRDRNTYQFNE